MPQAKKIVKSSQLLSFSQAPRLIYLQILCVLPSKYTQTLTASPHPHIYHSGPGQYHFSPRLWSSTRRVLCTCPTGDFDKVWRHFWSSQLGERVLLASSGQRPGALLDIVQCTGQPPTTKINVIPKCQRYRGHEISIYLNANSLLTDLLPPPFSPPHKSVLHTAA